jgi:ADP-heptose:LPS heptosyltransferase
MVGVLFFRPFLTIPNPKLLDRQLPYKILYVSLAFRGDLVVNFPTIAEIKKQFPNSRLTCWVREFNVSLAGLNSDIDEVFSYTDLSHSVPRALFEFAFAHKHRKLIEKLSGYDIFFDDAGYALTAIAGYKAKIPLRLGRNSQGFGFLNHYEFPYDQNSQLIERRLKLLRPFGVFLSLRDVYKPYFKIDAEIARKYLLELGLGGMGYFTVQPFAGWESKNWGIDKYCQVAKEFSEKSGLLPVFWGSEKDANLCEEALIRHQIKAMNICGKTDLDKSAFVISLAKFHLGPDSVGSHLAISLGIKSLTIFGPTNPWLSAYLNGNNFGILKRTRCTAKPGRMNCCFDGGVSCRRAASMKELDVDEVLMTLLGIWTGKERRSVIEF